MSNDARSHILERMRHALGRHGPGNAGETDEAARQTVEARLANPKPALVPARGDLDPEARIELFTQQAEAVQAHVLRIQTFAELPDLIADYLRQHNLPMNLVTATDPDLETLSWDDGFWDTRRGKPSDSDPVGLTTAVAGIAETGTLMLTSDIDHPTTLAFLPETSVVTLRSNLVFRAYEDALKAFRATEALPRSVNLITGPSRSGDIEQTLQLGAHGPKRLLIVLVDEVKAKDAIDDAERTEVKATTPKP
jgi:L-lactate dehydrogenase complex protein LldG